MENNINIPIRFQREIITHSLSNIVARNSNGNNKEIPLLLGIHGKSGQGKTYQIQQILKSIGFKVLHISGSQLESEKAGDPAKLIKKTYIEAASEFPKLNAILIDDIDAGLGNWGALYQYTVNTQIIIATLMHIADNPTIIDNKDVKRVPVIMTGNDFTKIYSPLSRPGRMRAFNWEPTFEEKLDILKPIFCSLSESDIKTLIKSFKEEPISFFTDLKSYAIQEKIWQFYNEYDKKDILNQLALGSGLKNEIHFNTPISELKNIGNEIKKNTTYINHLKESN